MVGNFAIQAHQVVSHCGQLDARTGQFGLQFAECGQYLGLEVSFGHGGFLKMDLRRGGDMLRLVRSVASRSGGQDGRECHTLSAIAFTDYLYPGRSA
jgi:hypothetical protein